MRRIDDSSAAFRKILVVPTPQWLDRSGSVKRRYGGGWTRSYSLVSSAWQ